jgi:hypothetical protein
MTVSLVDLPKGFELPETEFDFSPEWVAGYKAAVEDEVSGSLPDWRTPALALTTAAFGALLKQVALPEGTLHVGLELSGLTHTELDDIRILAGRVAARGERRGWVLMAIEFDVEDGTRVPILSGRTTITFPISAGRADTP